MASGRLGGYLAFLLACGCCCWKYSLLTQESGLNMVKILCYIELQGLEVYTVVIAFCEGFRH